MDLTIHEGDRDLLGVEVGEIGIVEDGLFCPWDAQVPAHLVDDHAGVITQMTTGFADEHDAGIIHAPSLAHTPSLR